jgi:prepilin-type processing-associated H-X9-DG protein
VNDRDCAQTRPGVSIIELLIVIGTIGCIASLLACAVQNVRNSAARLACENNLRQIALGLHSYHDTQGGLPLRPGVERQAVSTLSWMVCILPQIEQSDLWAISQAAILTDHLAFHDPPHIGYRTVIKLYVCPADARLLTPQTDQFGVTAAYSSYVGIAGSHKANGMLGSYPGVSFMSVTDGLSQTVMLGERPPPDSLLAGRWYTASQDIRWGILGPEFSMPVLCPAMVSDFQCVGPIYSFSYGRLDNSCDRYHLWSLHQGGANFGFADGSVRFLRYDVADILPSLATRAGGEVVVIPD